MSKFTIDVENENYENAFFYDNEFVCYEDDFDAILDKLNELAKENEQLQEEIREAKELAEYSASVNNMLITEFRNQIGQCTGQAKVSLQKLCEKEFVLEYPTKECSRLKEENEQLKEELQRFKKYVFSEDNILCYKCEHCIKKDIYVVDCEMKGKVDVHGLCSLFREVKV